MSLNTKSRNNKDTRRRSALSFVGGDGSLDIDHVLQSEPWKNIEKFEKSEAGCIQNMLDDFVNTIEAKEEFLKIIKGDTPAKKTPRSKKKVSTKSPIKDLSTDLPGTSSNTSSNIVESNTTVNKNKSLKKQSQFEISEMEMIPQKLPHDTDDVKEEIQNISEADVKESVDSNKKMIKKMILQDIKNITEKKLQTSTPKKITPKIVKKTIKKKESTAENKTPKTRNSENKSEKNVQRKEIQKKSKNTKEQVKSSTNILEEEEKTNVNLENDLEEMIPQKLPRNTDDAKEKTKKSSKATAKKSVKSDKKIKKGIVQNTANITDENLQTSTSKKEASEIKKKTAKKKESTTENKKPKTGNSENKSEKHVQRKKIQKKSKNTKEQAKSNTNMLGEEKKINVNLKHNLECNKVNQNSSKNKIKNEKAKSSATFLSEMEKCEVAEINNNIEKDAKSKEYNKSTSNQLKRKSLKKENLENKLQKSAHLRISLESSQINTIENTKCQCEKNPAKCSDNQCSLKAKEDYEQKRQRKKSLKAAKAIEDLSRHITVVKKKMKCIKNDLESNELNSDNSFIKESSFSSLSTYSFSSSYSSHSYSSCSCSSGSCSCSCSDTSEYSSVFSSTSGSSKSYSETETSSEKED